jgi:hypothetical protein
MGKKIKEENFLNLKGWKKKELNKIQHFQHAQFNAVSERR